MSDQAGKLPSSFDALRDLAIEGEAWGHTLLDLRGDDLDGPKWPYAVDRFMRRLAAAVDLVEGELLASRKSRDLQPARGE
jgi:hypothetical protein